MNKLLISLAEEQKKLQNLKIIFTADTIKKTPEMVFIRFQFAVDGLYCTSKYSTGIKCLRTAWHKETATIVDENTLSQYLQITKQEIEKKYLELCKTNPNTTANDLYFSLVDRSKFAQQKTKHANQRQTQTKFTKVIEVLKWYRDSKKEQEQSYSTKTIQYQCAFWLSYLTKYKLHNLLLRDVSPKFLTTFYEQQASTYKHNYLLLLCAYFRSAFANATDKQLIPKIHLEKLRKGGHEATRTEAYISIEDYDKLKSFVFDTKKYNGKILDQARDIYVFMCETGFCYADYIGFDYALHVKSYKDMQVFCKKRHKLRRVKNDKTVSQRGLLSEVAIKILAKYANILPKIEYQALQYRLGKISKLLDIPYLSHTHSARHSAGMLLLNAGLAIQDVQAFMGHKNLATTQSTYAIAETEKIAEAMQKIKKKPL